MLEMVRFEYASSLGAHPYSDNAYMFWLQHLHDKNIVYRDLKPEAWAACQPWALPVMDLCKKWLM